MCGLALRATKGKLKGTFSVNSAPRQNSSYARASVLVQQDDIFFPGDFLPTSCPECMTAASPTGSDYWEIHHHQSVNGIQHDV